MDSIYNLQKRAATLRGKTQVDSITPEEVGGLHADTLAYLATFEQNAEALGIRKTYATAAAMQADKSPVGTNGKPLRYGQLVCLYNAANPDADGTGNVYAFQKPGWLLVGNLSNLNEFETKIAAAQTSAAAAQATAEKAGTAAATAQSAADAAQTTADGAATAATVAQTAAEAAQSAADTAQATADKAQTAATAAQSAADAAQAGVDKGAGVAFAGFLDNAVTLSAGMGDGSVRGTAVYYCRPLGHFVLFAPTDAGDARYFKSWTGGGQTVEFPDSHYQGGWGADGATLPFRTKVYLSSGTAYVWPSISAGLLPVKADDPEAVKGTAVTEAEYERMQEAGTLREDRFYFVYEDE